MSYLIDAQLSFMQEVFGEKMFRSNIEGVSEKTWKESMAVVEESCPALTGPSPNFV